MESFNVYKDISDRTNGEIYIGVVGPVRTGKSTFIKRFMDLLVIPGIEDVHEKERAIDELPQSAAGRTIMTTEPKFIPKKAAEIAMDEDTKVKFRLIDCVGYMVDGAAGHSEGDKERLVKTPWFDDEIPFTKAAEIGTRKVINEHSTIGIVITTDGSFGEIERSSYVEPEEKTINELKKIGKPFLILLNTDKPYSKETLELAKSLEEKYGNTVLPVNCSQLRREDITKIMEEILWNFPLKSVHFYIPQWVDMLPVEHPIKEELIGFVKSILANVSRMKDVREAPKPENATYMKNCKLSGIQMEQGNVSFLIDLDDKYYYETISEMVGIPLESEYQLINALKELVEIKTSYEKVSDACEEVRFKGYGVVTPSEDEIQIEQPEIIRHGNKFGVKIKATAPSIHMIRANIETEIAPIVGSEEQAADLITYIEDTAANNPEGILDTNIFGKSIKQLVDEGIRNKVYKLNEESQTKLQDTIQKVVNDNNGGLVCIII
ncbi:stage IV sporulation protein A [Anaerolentibacter hominis]|uniref:stage IV sporulation protein A n=1 Tax=Anaerolentibacter hominis TaxID=3079009 RepID=UPI0031B87561